MYAALRACWTQPPKDEARSIKRNRCNERSVALFLPTRKTTRQIEKRRDGQAAQSALLSLNEKLPCHSTGHSQGHAEAAAANDDLRDLLVEEDLLLPDGKR